MKTLRWILMFFHLNLSAQVVINEVLYDPIGSDSQKEWIELFNSGADSVLLDGWRIYSAGSSFKLQFTFPSFYLPAKSYLLVGGNQVEDRDFTAKFSFQNGGSATDAIKLVDSTGICIDALFYDEPNKNLLVDESGKPAEVFAVDVKGGNTLARFAGGYDTDNSKADFFESTQPTPGKSNTLQKPQQGKGLLVINEVLYNPEGSDAKKEWIEIFNPQSESVDLYGWKLYSAGKIFEQDYLFPEMEIAPKAYILVGGEDVPNVDVVVGFSLQNGGSATDGIKLANPDESYADFLFYDQPNSNNLRGEDGNNATSFAPNVEAGNSLARYPDKGDSNDCQLDFFQSKKPTPKGENFIPIDLELTTISFAKGELSTKIRNLSTTEADNSKSSINVEFGSSLKFSFPIDQIPSLGWVTQVFQLTEIKENPTLIKVHLVNDKDFDNTNNYKQITVFSADEKIVVNEVLFAPLTGGTEWVELYNQIEKKLSLTDYKMVDFLGGVIAFSALIEMKGYLVICQDSTNFLQTYPQVNQKYIVQAKSWATLNNDADKLTLTDGYLNPIDSMSYVGQVEKSGTSLEKLGYGEFSGFWGESIALGGSTPAAKNSIFIQYLDEDFVASIDKKSIKPAEDDTLTLTYSLPTKSFRAFVRCRVFDYWGNLVVNLINYKKMRVADSLQFDGKDAKGNYLAEGVYILKFEATAGESVFAEDFYITILR